MNLVAHNLMAMNSARQYKVSNKAKAKSTEKLSSGYKINRASDDAAGLSISEKMRSQIRGLNQGAENIEDGISYAQVADGALNEVHDLLQRMNELAVQSANGTNSKSDREALDAEMQQLKTEMERIFTTTKFNEKQVWPEENIKKTAVLIGTTRVDAVRDLTPSSQYINNISNANYDKVACGGYHISADDDGVQITWEDYDGQEHKTQKVDWSTFEANNYSMNVADYFDPADTELFDPATGDPLFDFKIAYEVAEEATRDDIIQSINNTYMGSSCNAFVDARWEDASGNPLHKDVSVYSSYINYGAAYASKENAPTSGYDFDNGSDDFATPTLGGATAGNLDSIPTGNTSDVEVAKNSTDTWSFTFNIEGIGEVKATSDKISYYSYDGFDRKDNEKDIWWYSWQSGRYTYTDEKWYRPNGHNEGTLGSLMEALTGDANSETPGLLSSGINPPSQGGASRRGGDIRIHFSLTSANAYTYGKNQSSDSVGSITLEISVTNADTEASILQKINDALNENTILDLSVSEDQADIAYQVVWDPGVHTTQVNRDVFRIDKSYENVDVNIHGGPATEDKILMKYKTLRIEAIGLTDTNVMTEANSDEAIKSVSEAIQMVSQQRSLFGSYQNRMEHAKAIVENVEENTTAAESRIRDTDMAEEMVEYSKNNILAQVGQSMLAQANQSTQGVLSLLG